MGGPKMFLEAVKERASEAQCLGARQYNLVCLLSKDGGKAITLKVQMQNEETLFYRMGRNAKFNILVMDYCVRKQLGLGTIHFVGPDGKTLGETKTPQGLGMKDGDVIDALCHQING
ncbi:hypothetical protein RIF29_29404 [Crotalaria pallida]|uniref:Rad60/SUMO-like domain-containing protein n=1 Tax=Crotalaria pallida TaxID=3830 RepID=A0AAN9EJQ9_CROPI